MKTKSPGRENLAVQGGVTAQVERNAKRQKQEASGGQKIKEKKDRKVKNEDER